MANLTQKHYLDLVAGIRAPITVHVSLGDVGETITFNVLKDGEIYNFTNESVAVYGTRSDGAGFGPVSCTYSGNTVSFNLTSAMTSVAGASVVELSITASNGVKVGTPNFAMLVENSAFPNGVVYDTDRSVYESILKYVQGLQANTIKNAVNSAGQYADAKDAALNAALSGRIDNLVVNAGGSSITEVVDARVDFTGTNRTSLTGRLSKFLEYTVKGQTEDI